MFNKKFALMIFCFLVFITISSVCASDDSNMVSLDNQSLTDVSADVSSFSDLEKDIGNLSSGDVYNINKDYVFDFGCGGNVLNINIGHPYIDISVDNVTLNGNGHVIDGNYKAPFFNVSGNNVKIYNLTFINSKYEFLHIPVNGGICLGNDDSFKLIISYYDSLSPITWMGDNGLISSCVFSHNTAINGGAITWKGKNGVINNSLFIDNVAKGIGGAIYVVGTNTTIANTVFVNSTSQLSGETIYLDRKTGNTTVLNCTCNSDLFMFDGNITGIDVDYLKYSYYSQVGDSWVNLIPILYKAIMYGFASITDNLSCTALYTNVTDDFSLTVIKNFPEFAMDYQKSYYFKVDSLNNVFESLFNDNYEYGLSIIKNIHINNLYEYESLCWCNGEDLLDKNFMNMILPDYKQMSEDIIRFKSIACVLNVYFAANMIINSRAQWYSKSGFDIVNIFGNGARIKASTTDDDEFVWLYLGKGAPIYIINDLTVGGFNTAIHNVGGYCILNNVVLNNNRMDYMIHEDYGAAIRNEAVVVCNNCSFINNYAKYGGAIYNNGALDLNNCTFKGNKAYGKGDNVLDVGDGIVKIDGKEVKGTSTVNYIKSRCNMAIVYSLIIIAAGALVVALFAPFLGAIAVFGCAMAVALINFGGVLIYIYMTY